MSIIFDKNGIIFETRTNREILDKTPLSVCYTLNTDDITKGKKPPQTPYADRHDELIFIGDKWYATNTKTTLTATTYKNGLLFHMETKANNLSEFGINLPLNFMGKLNGGGWKNQYLFNSPYMSRNKDIIYFYLTSPCENNLLIAIKGVAQGWKMDYSPFSWGHYFVNLKLLATYDKAYNTPQGRQSLEFVILPVDSFNSCLKELTNVYDVPFLDYNISGGKIGDEIEIYPYGEYDVLIEEHKGKVRELPFSQKYKIKHEGEVRLTLKKGDKLGGDITVYGYNSLFELYKKSMNSVDLDIIKKHTDGNLCEHQCWAGATLRFLSKYKDKLSYEEITALESKTLSLLDIITEEKEEKATEHRTILNKPHLNFPAYNVYKSQRVQELFFGITILLDAYKYFGDKKYLIYAKGATECLLSHYQKDDGRIEVDWGNSKEDYTTVCCPMIPIVDMAVYFINIDKDFSSKCFNSAYKMAEFLFNRGLSFPTEGAKSSLVEEEMEDGSISCTALCLLYYCKYVSKEEKYIKKAKEILDLHDSWVIKTPICQMHGSSLRWWETQWEGDADGPAICAGHAWSIWRAEADLLYYLLTNDNCHLTKATNGFMTNISKIRENGVTYAIYSPDEIPGGGFSDKAECVRFEIAPRLPNIPDCGLSRYVWLRIANYLCHTGLEPMCIEN
ncbi:MAG: hypothetical protein J6D23_00025 [Clostridia bacterium]|nr:hypothetical protein [Clostridia bacterium]